MSYGEGAELGFCEEAESWNLLSRYLPSKVGGKPSWLDLKNIPKSSDLKCLNCGKGLAFLLQLYAPVDDSNGEPVKATCYHRTVFVFCCKECGKTFKTFRSQLPQRNEFYPPEDPEDRENWHPEIIVDKFTKVCSYCGCGSMSVCSKCKKRSYCGREHQIADWSKHKKFCQNTNGSQTKEEESRNDFLFPEFKIVIEEETLGKVEKTVKCELNRLNDLKKEGKAGIFADDPTVDAELNAIGTSEDKHFMKFKDLIKHNQDQVIRYNKAKPLWVSDKNIPSEIDIAKCQYCDGKRTFEFQVMPQLLNSLNLDPLKDPLDWGTLAIFTCENNCDEGPNYKEEFIWKQDFVSET
ncbi:programmed cell death protein 2-like [Artemia franciscana]|uniref:MYND-type domain-containing protein n=1 Tax=Artemia franciscana TaxID=6661 RepID=A0AA88HLB4_ARTSF|nr:hypothetical protein QYM36_015315 [Artemia franciscana]